MLSAIRCFFKRYFWQLKQNDINLTIINCVQKKGEKIVFCHGLYVGQMTSFLSTHLTGFSIVFGRCVQLVAALWSSYPALVTPCFVIYILFHNNRKLQKTLEKCDMGIKFLLNRYANEFVSLSNFLCTLEC